MRFLIIGCGSMGKRRARGLRALGYDQIAAYDPRQDRLAEIDLQSEVEVYEELELAIVDGIDFALVCVPPHLHASVLMRCIDAGVPVFCEAPLTLTLESADAVIDAAESTGVFLAPSCTYLHHDIHHMIAEIVREERFGKPLAALSYVGQHVADWHPYEDYRGFYASKRSEGGMCIDMLPHDLHLFTHFFGDVRSMSCMARRRSREIESDAGAYDVYDVLLDMESEVSLTLHQDMFQRPWGNYRKIMCERGAIEWNWQHIRVCEYGGPQFPNVPQWQDVTPDKLDFEGMYINEIEHALRSMKGDEPYLMPPRKERRILEIVLACEESSRTGKHIVW
jgi:predicted dehydrogenase